MNIDTADQWPAFDTGQVIELSGDIITARDATLKVIFESEQDTLLKDAVVYFCGPTPAPEGRVIGSCGPTTASRMEPFFEQMCHAGVKGLIGKGQISKKAHALLDQHKVVYFSAIGGAGAVYGGCVESAKVIAFAELGPEAIYQMQVKDFVAVVQ